MSVNIGFLTIKNVSFVWRQFDSLSDSNSRCSHTLSSPLHWRRHMSKSRCHRMCLFLTPFPRKVSSSWEGIGKRKKEKNLVNYTSIIFSLLFDSAYDRKRSCVQFPSNARWKWCQSHARLMMSGAWFISSNDCLNNRLLGTKKRPGLATSDVLPFFSVWRQIHTTTFPKLRHDTEHVSKFGEKTTTSNTSISNV